MYSAFLCFVFLCGRTINSCEPFKLFLVISLFTSSLSNRSSKTMIQRLRKERRHHLLICPSPVSIHVPFLCFGHLLRIIAQLFHEALFQVDLFGGGIYSSLTTFSPTTATNEQSGEIEAIISVIEPNRFLQRSDINPNSNGITEI